MSIEVKNVYKYFGEQAAVKDISFSVKKGEIVGFLGPNGAGKSTTMRMITGFLPVSSGEIYVSGLKVGIDNLKTQQKIGYLPENNPLYVDMYVKEYLEFVGRIYKVPSLKSRIKEMIEAVGLELEQHKKIGALSKGYRQRVGLAQAIIHDPEVLILDEPTSGLDPNQLVEIRELIKSIGKEKTLMLSTHIMQEAEAICDKIVIISKGEIVTNKSTLDLQKQASGEFLFVEFQQEVSKSQLKKIKGVDGVESYYNGFLLKSNSLDELKINVSQFTQENNLVIMTLTTESKSLEEIFKDSTSNVKYSYGVKNEQDSVKSNSESEIKSTEIIYLVLSFFIPLLGIFNYFSFRSTDKERARRFIVSAFAGFLFIFMVRLIWAFLRL